MFGPNDKATFDGRRFHHRGQAFKSLLRTVKRTFVEVFGLYDYDVLVLTGSGTFANEVVLSSFRGDMQTHHCDAEFGRRLMATRDMYDHGPCIDLSVKGLAYPLYETSISRLNTVLDVSGTEHMTFADMVSAFPYYDVPTGTDVFTTVSSKQLGGYPVLGIIGIRKDLRIGRFFSHRSGSILDVYRHMAFSGKDETLNTPAIPLYASLLQELENFDLDAHRTKIDDRRDLLLSVLPNELVVGTGPVLTIKKDQRLIPIAERFDLYVSNAGYQLFLWSGDDAAYDELHKCLKTLFVTELT